MTDTADYHKIKARHVKFDFSDTPVTWVPNDPGSTHIINTLNLLFPEGELWFCRVYNKALPLITDARLRDEAEGFLRQEAVHSRSHGGVLKHYYDRHGIDTKPFTQKLNRLFTRVLGEQPLGLKIGHTRFWLRQQLAVIASLEHFFGYLGNWVLNAHGRRRPCRPDDGRPAALARRRGSRAPHGRVRHLPAPGRHLSGALRAHGVRDPAAALLHHDGCEVHVPARPGRRPLPGFRARVVAGSRRGHLPSFWKVIGAALRYFKPGYTPHHEGSTEQALAYLARSPAAQARARRQLGHDEGCLNGFRPAGVARRNAYNRGFISRRCRDGHEENRSRKEQGAQADARAEAIQLRAFR